MDEYDTGGEEIPKSTAYVMVVLMAENGGQKLDECYIKKYSGSGKGATLEIRQAWCWRTRQGSSGVRVRCRERWVSGCWDGYRRQPGGKMILYGDTAAVMGERAREGAGTHSPLSRAESGRRAEKGRAG